MLYRLNCLVGRDGVVYRNEYMGICVECTGSGLCVQFYLLKLLVALILHGGNEGDNLHAPWGQFHRAAFKSKKFALARK